MGFCFFFVQPTQFDFAVVTFQAAASLQEEQAGEGTGGDGATGLLAAHAAQEVGPALRHCKAAPVWSAFPHLWFTRKRARTYTHTPKTTNQPFFPRLIHPECPDRRNSCGMMQGRCNTVACSRVSVIFVFFVKFPALESSAPKM